MRTLTKDPARRDPARFDRRLYPPMVLGSILNPINSSMIAVSLVPIARDFGVSAAATAWLVSGLYLATSIGQPVVGRLVDAFGARRVFLVGTSLAGVAGLMGLFAQDLATLVAARVVLGFATCAGYPSSMHLIRREARRTGRDSPAAALTVLSLSAQTMSVVGPTFGGFLVGAAGWRAVFSVNIPLALACLVLGALFLPKEHPARSGPLRLDVAGMGLFAAAIVAFLLFLLEPAAAHWYLLAVAGACLAGFVVRELRTEAPFVDLHVLRSTPALSLTYLRQFLSGVFGYSFLYGFTQWLEAGAGFSAERTGLLLLPMSLLAIVVTALTGRRAGIRGKLHVGAVGQLLAAALMLVCRADSPVLLLIAVSLAVGVPQGLLNLANQNALYAAAPPERTASSAGLLRTFFYLGAIVSSAANGLLLAGPDPTAGMHDMATALLAVALAFTALTVPDRSLRSPHPGR